MKMLNTFFFKIFIIHDKNFILYWPPGVPFAKMVCRFVPYAIRQTILAKGTAHSLTQGKSSPKTQKGWLFNEKPPLCVHVTGETFCFLVLSVYLGVCIAGTRSVCA